MKPTFIGSKNIQTYTSSTLHPTNYKYEVWSCLPSAGCAVLATPPPTGRVARCWPATPCPAATRVPRIKSLQTTNSIRRSLWEWCTKLGRKFWVIHYIERTRMIVMNCNLNLHFVLPVAKQYNKRRTKDMELPFQLPN